MEAVKKDRTQQRRLFTLACNAFEKEEDQLDLDSKILKLKIIEEKALLMIQTEENFKQLLYEDKNSTDIIIEKEIDESEVYIDRWRNLKCKLEKLFVNNEDCSKLNSICQQNALLCYPKLKLATFDGDIRNYLSFWGQFQKIDQDPNIDLHDKFAYLSQAMEKGSPAEELIKSFPPGGNSYKSALKQLKIRFGRDELLIQVYVRDLLSLVLQKQNSEKKSLRKLFDQLESKLRSLELLGVTSEKYASMLFPLVESSLPEETLVAWERYRSTNRRVRKTDPEKDHSDGVTEKNDLESILEFLQDEVEAEERIMLASQSFSNPKEMINTKRNVRFRSEKKMLSNSIPSATDLLTTPQRPKQCIFCKNFHYSGDCIKVRKMPLREREMLTQQSHCCFLCLKPGHIVRKCVTRAGCLCCGKKHHILLCRNMQQPAETSNDKDSLPNESTKAITPGQDQALASMSRTSGVMLQTLKVVIRSNGKRRAARAIIDTASERSYLLQDTAKRMAIKPEGSEYLQHSLFGGNSTGICSHDVFTLYLSSVDGNYNCNFKVLSQPIICGSVPPIAPELCLDEIADNNIDITDDFQGPIEILIGADVAGKLLTGKHHVLPCGLAAVETKLGWTLMGRIPQDSPSSSASLITITSMLSRVESITDLWTLDTLGITDPLVKRSQSELQEAAKQHFIETVQIEDGRFLVQLPWLDDHPALPDNFELALRRLSSTVKRLKSESLYEAYEEVFNEWLEEGIIEEIKDDHEVHTHYLPHRAVVKNYSTTKIRPVFDASARMKGLPSLNDCLEKGPNVIELIPNILMRFRQERIGVISDIRKAFLQIGIANADRNYLRFLWYARDGVLKTYRHCRVVFGVSCSPFLLGSVIKYHLELTLQKINHGESSHPINVIEKLLNSFYVDNCVSSVKDKIELNCFISVSRRVMAERKFDLRGWEFTDPDSVAQIDSNVLGLIWERKSDTLRVNTKFLNELCFERVTKRTILSAAHRLFDPIGVTCPLSLIPKLLLQETWKMNKTWDEEVDLNTRDKFLKWIKNVTILEDVRFPRYLGADIGKGNFSLHFFCDASKHAYAATAFIRSESGDSIKVQLLQAKSRVAPTGKGETTIARLELLAATIVSRLSSNILAEMPCENVYFWTDSSTVLAWIAREEAWGVFVQNRVNEIRRITNKSSWRHVPGVMNPADLPSRGCSAQQLINSKWWEGPSWLYSPCENWPVTSNTYDESEILKERKRGIMSSVPKSLVSVCLNTSRDWYYRYFSKYSKIVNLVAWTLRFIVNCRLKKTDRRHGHLDSKEIADAEKKIIKMVQEECFMNEQDDKLKSLRAFKDDNGIIRLKTKLTFREDTMDFRMPAILPSQHEIVKRGWWERLIGILKKLLRRVLGRASLTYEEMITILCDCESIINSRPLTYLAENEADLIPLSPALFLQDIKTSGIPDLDIVSHESLNKRVKYRQKLQRDLRQRFRSEYLGTLIQRPEKNKAGMISLGDIVLIGSDNIKRINWPLGKIIEVIPGKEGITRLVKLQTANGQLLRPVQRLYPLEINNNNPLVEHSLTRLAEEQLPSRTTLSNNDANVKIRKTRSGRTVKVPERLGI